MYACRAVAVEVVLHFWSARRPARSLAAAACLGVERRRGRLVAQCALDDLDGLVAHALQAALAPLLADRERVERGERGRGDGVAARRRELEREVCAPAARPAARAKHNTHTYIFHTARTAHT